MDFKLTQFLLAGPGIRAANPATAPFLAIMPDILVQPLASLNEGMIGDNMVFKLNQNLRSRKKSRRENSSSENSKSLHFEAQSENSKSLHFEAQVDHINGQTYLDVENSDMQDVLDALDRNNNGTISKREMKGVTATAITDVSLIENHSRDADVTSYMKSEDVFFKYTPEPIAFGKPGPGTLEFNTDIVQVGLDDEGNVISFICPQETQKIDSYFVKGSVKSEVEVGEVGGKIDPLTGKGTMYADELAWKFWGDMKIFGKKVSISKEDAAFIPIEDATGTGGLLALESIEKSAHGGGNIDNIFSSYFVKGLQGNPSGIQKGALQETLIKAVNAYLPGFANGGTDIQWNIDLQSPITVIGDEYVNNAHNLEMH